MPISGRPISLECDRKELGAKDAAVLVNLFLDFVGPKKTCKQDSKSAGHNLNRIGTKKLQALTSIRMFPQGSK